MSVMRTLWEGDVRVNALYLKYYEEIDACTICCSNKSACNPN